LAKDTTKETPLMQQYNAIKTKYPGALLLFRVGDFFTKPLARMLSKQQAFWALC